MHININSLLRKINELRSIAKVSEAAVIDISEPKLDHSVLPSKTQNENYGLIRSDRNIYGDPVACFIRKDLFYNKKSFFSPEIENIFMKIFLPHSKALIRGSFTEIITEHFSKINTNNSSNM